MTLYVSKLNRLRGIQESSFGTDMSGSMGSFFEVPFDTEVGATVTLNAPVQTPGHVQQLLDGYPVGVLLPRGAILDFQVNLETFTTKATSTVAATEHWLGKILEAALGGSHLMTGSTCTTAGTTTTAVASVATTLRPGGAIGLVNSSGELEVREIKSKSGSTLTQKLATSFSSGTTNTIYGSASYFPSPYSTGASFVGLQFACEGQSPEDRYLLRGGWLSASPTLNLTPGQIPTIKFQFTFADWDQADGSATAGDLTGSTLGRSTYSDVVTMVLADSELRSQANGTSTLSAATLLGASTIEFTPNINYAAPRTPKGLNTILQAVRIHQAPVISGSFVIPYEDQTWFNLRDARTRHGLWLQIGSVPANGAVLIAAPSIQVTNVQRQDVGGVQGQKVDWVGLLDEDCTPESSYEALGYAAFRFHFL